MRLGESRLAVWPDGQEIKPRGDRYIFGTRFADIDAYHRRLREHILGLENDTTHSRWLFRGGCGRKVHDIDRWGCPEADLIHARARALFCRALGVEQSVVDSCWANITQPGDYCMPHSHSRASGSIVYSLDPGDTDPDHELSGQLCFVDPRIESCCQIEPGCMTTLYTPGMPPGSMILFPGKYVHCVAPYTGHRPRLTLSWNINTQALPPGLYDDLRRESDAQAHK